jgi:hypothetical protein
MSQRYNYFLGKSGKLIDFASHKVPVFKEEKGNDWVVWGYDKEDRTWRNRYGDYLIWLYNSSAKNNAIINGKNTYIVGEGWGVNYKTEEKKQDLNTKLKAQGFIAELEASKITRDLSLDRVIFGGFAAQMIPNKKGDSGMAHHLDFSKVRVKKKEYNEDGTVKPRVYAYTCDWTNRKPQDNPDFQIFHEFPWDWKEVDKDKKYLVYYKDYRPNLGDYPLPEYIGAIPYIAADYEIGNFTYNNVREGFSAGVLVNFYGGEPSENQKAQIEERWKATKHGGDKAGDPILSFNEDKDSGIEVTPLSANGQDDRFLNLNEQIRDEIYTGHGFNPTLIGLSNANGFNNNADELRVASEMLQVTYVSQQQGVLEDFFNSLADINEIKGEFFIKELEPVTEALSEAALLSVLSTNEVREKAGLDPVEFEVNKVSEAIATLSPLVATKVLDAMSLEEVRQLVGLTTTGPITKTTETLSTEFSKEQEGKLIKAFENCGTDDSELELIDSRELFANNTQDAISQGDRFKFESKKANALLGVLNATPDLTKTELEELTGLDGSEIDSLLSELESEGLVENGIPTPEGQQVQQEIFVVYKYGLRFELKGQEEEIAGTRDFCSNLVRLSKSRSWTIADINAMNNDQGLDVFSSRGGFWNDPKAGTTHPYCRHIWEQRLVTRK